MIGTFHMVTLARQGTQEAASSQQHCLLGFPKLLSRRVVHGTTDNEVTQLQRTSSLGKQEQFENVCFLTMLQRICRE